MRALRLSAAAAVLVLFGTACGDDGSTPPQNEGPAAAFTLPACTINIPCAFASASTDDAAVTAWSWDFDGDGTADATTEDAAFTYTEDGTFEVTLTVSDADGLTDAETKSITIAPVPPGNIPPTAGFTFACTDATCEFASTSTDEAPGSIAAHAWVFGDGNVSGEASPSHTYVVTEPAEFTVTLTVTDDEGATDTETETVSVTPPPAANTPPTAGFTFTCTAASCTFTSTSTDAAPGTIASYAWTFGDGGVATIANPTHDYTVGAPTDFTVTLTVTDNEGAVDSETQTVSVAPAPNTPPTAGFTVSCTDGTCTFTSTSTDAAPGTITTFAWLFGDGGASSEQNPSHSYAVTAPTDFTVTLTVTDNEGATDSETQTVSVTPPPAGSEGCVTSGTRVDCALDIAARSTIKLKLLGISCDLNHERVVIPPPIGDQVFLNVCTKAVNDSTKIFGGPEDEAIIFEAGSQAVIRFVQGDQPSGEPTLAAPSAQLTGTFPNWTINFEDGDNAGEPGEPDFADVVLSVEAVPED